MKTLKFICFAVAFFISILMFITTGLFIKMNSNPMEPLISSRFFITALHMICTIKFVVLVIMLMPDKPALKQISIGFILADAAVLLLGNNTNLIINVPVSFVVAQVVLLLFYMALQGRLWVYKVNTANSTIENELIASPI